MIVIVIIVLNLVGDQILIIQNYHQIIFIFHLLMKLKHQMTIFYLIKIKK